MKSWQRALLVLSVAINAAFLMAYLMRAEQNAESIAASGAPTPQAREVERARREIPAAKSDLTSAQIGTLYRKLLDSGFSEPQARMAVVGVTETQVRARSADEYWVAADIRTAREHVARYHEREAARGLLVAAFGPSIADDASSASVFAPYAREFPFLSAAKQRELEKIVTTGESSGRARHAQDQQAIASAVRSLLTSEEWVEFQMRTSPLARQLLSLQFSFSEPEFRKVFLALLAQQGAQGASRPAFSTGGVGPEVQEALRTALGTERFAEYEKKQDPTYQVLRTLGDTFALKEPAIEGAYEVLRTSAVEINEIQRAGPILSISSRSRLRAVTAQRDENLRRLLGDRAFEMGARSLAISSPDYQGTGIPLAVRPEGSIAVENFK